VSGFLALQKPLYDVIDMVAAVAGRYPVLVLHHEAWLFEDARADALVIY
jgi:hypothetical protein